MSHQELPTYFAPNAFEAIRPTGADVTYDVDKLGRLGQFINNELGMRLPGHVGTLQYVYRGTAAAKQIGNDGPYYRQSLDFEYVPASELAIPVDEKPATVDRRTIAAVGKKVFEIIVRDPNEPLDHAFARTLSYPQIQDAGFAVGLGSWHRGFKELAPGRDGKRKAALAEAAKQFAGAILLRPRP